MSLWKANRLRVIRAEKRITQRDAARRMGVSQGTWWKWENAYDEPDTKERARIARALRVSVDTLLPIDPQAVAS